MIAAIKTDATKAIDYVIGNETFNSHGQLVSKYENKDTGEISNWGISLKWLKGIDPEATADTVRNLTREAAADLYQKYWWEKLEINLIPSQRVATKLLDTCVNCGGRTGIKLLQRTMEIPEHDRDGLVGPQTLRFISDELAFKNGEQMLLDSMAADQATHYEEVVEENPALKPNLAEWLKRAEKLPA